jgi:polysaccharide biosynthesis transport protein
VSRDEFGSSEEPAGDSFIGYLPSIMWQRRWLLVVPGVAGLAAGTAAAFLIPSTYRSSATLLVESAGLPAEVTGTQATNSIDQRIAKIRQQVLSRPDLIQLIEANGLYSELRQEQPMSALIERMRKATTISPVNADVAANRGPSTIAFSLTFDYPDAAKAQIVAQGFVERLMKLDATQTARDTAQAAQFLQDQTDELARQVSELESQINQIKAANGVALSSQGTMVLPSSGGGVQTQIAALRRENAQLTAQLGMQSNAADRDQGVLAAEAQLANVRSIYSDNHPDVRLAQQRLAEAKQLARRNVALQDNAVSSTRQQIAANNATIGALANAQSEEEGRSIALRAAQSRAPAINDQVSQLQARLDGLRKNYETSATKLMTARGAEKLAEQQKSERLSVIDPPVVPDSPYWPNRLLFILGGIVAGLGLGLALAMLIELFKRPVRGVAALQRITGEIPLVVVPVVNAPRRWPFFGRKARGTRRSKAEQN